MSDKVNHSALAADSTARDSYHHGDLRAQLMALALRHIEAHGTEKLSLRALAREAGVSATAPYRHFPTKRCLLAALATQGFAQLQQVIETTVDEQLAPSERLVQVGTSYISFALQNPTTYNLMFGNVLGDFSDYESLGSASQESFDSLMRHVNSLIESGHHDVNPELLGGVSWSMVHGLASLLLHVPANGQSKPARSVAALREDPETAIRLMMSKWL